MKETKKYRGERGRYIEKEVADANPLTTNSEVDKKITGQKAVQIFGKLLRESKEARDAFGQMYQRRAYEILSEADLDDLEKLSVEISEMVLKTFTGED